MKLLKLSAILAGLVIVPFIYNKLKSAPVTDSSDENKRYDIDDYVTEQML